MPTDVELPSGAPPIIPVVVIDDAEAGPPLAKALLAGGIQAVEVTLRTPAACDAIARIAAEAPGILIGAGTVLTPADVERVRAAGAQFIVSPGATPALLDAVEASGLPFLPGAATPSEAMALQERGYRRLKYFPADAHGGLIGLKGLAGPLPDLSFCPTGGINAANASDFLALKNCFAVGGSWLAPTDAILAGDWAQIERLACEAAKLV